MKFEGQKDVAALKSLYDELNERFTLVYNKITNPGHIGHLESGLQSVERYINLLESRPLGDKRKNIDSILSSMIIDERIISTYKTTS